MSILVSVITVNEWAYVFQLNFIETGGRPDLANLPTSVLDTKPLTLKLTVCRRGRHGSEPEDNRYYVRSRHRIKVAPQPTTF